MLYYLLPTIITETCVAEESSLIIIISCYFSCFGSLMGSHSHLSHFVLVTLFFWQQIWRGMPMRKGSFREFSGGMLITKAIHCLIEWASNWVSLLIMFIHSCSSLIRYFSSIWFNFHILESAFLFSWPLGYRGWLYSGILSLNHQITCSNQILAFNLIGKDILAFMRLFDLMNKVGRSSSLVSVLLVSHVDISFLPSKLPRPTMLVAIYIIIDDLFLLQLAISCPLKDVIDYSCISISLMHSGLWLTL